MYMKVHVCRTAQILNLVPVPRYPNTLEHFAVSSLKLQYSRQYRTSLPKYTPVLSIVLRLYYFEVATYCTSKYQLHVLISRSR